VVAFSPSVHRILLVSLEPLGRVGFTVRVRPLYTHVTWGVQMGKKKRIKSGKPDIQLPRNALERINLGQAFAEYDKVLTKPGVFVITPAIEVARDDSRSRCFFIGRRGTGKTAITYYIAANERRALSIHPQVLDPLLFPLKKDSLLDTRDRPFRSLVEVFVRGILDEVLSDWLRHGALKEEHCSPAIRKELRYIRDYDFDLRILELLQAVCEPLEGKDEKKWLKEIGKAKKIAHAMSEVSRTAVAQKILIDRIDDSWDGSDVAVVMLMALMHACIEISQYTDAARPLLFLRENVFDRVRQIDPESTRLETCVVSMDWTDELLMEMIERRLVQPFNTKLAIRGPTWEYFFEGGTSGPTRAAIFDYCQRRPRDVLTYCDFALQIARSKNHEKILLDDVFGARRRFSETRLKDLGDEYSENFSRIAVVLSRFYGLGYAFTIAGVDAFIRKLLNDSEVKELCKTWIYQYTAPERFISLMYNIGFFGIKSGSQVTYRSLGPSSTEPPALTVATEVVIHPSYRDALDLRDIVIGELSQDTDWQKTGLLTDIPAALDLTEYQDRLEALKNELQTIPCGKEHAVVWRDAVGRLLELCFYRWLSNPQKEVPDAAGCTIKDWIVSNRATGGFWEMVRVRYNATQIVWECKNYEKLKAADFQQVTSYINEAIGRFAVIAFRGELVRHYYDHLRKIMNEKDGFVLLLTTRDLLVFVRQALKGKVTENHIQDRYDSIARMIS